MHVDIGRLLPPSLGFGSSSPTAIGSPPQPEPAVPGQRMIQRVGSSEGSVQGDIGQRIQSASGSGGKLDEGVQQHLEQNLGADLSSVRIHTDGEADRLSKSVNAIAFTTGQDIFFSSGSYNPSSSEGKHLIAHEVVHTVQQANGAVSGNTMGNGISVSDPSDAFEQEAERVAGQVMSMPDTATQQFIQREILEKDKIHTARSLQRPPDVDLPAGSNFESRLSSNRGEESLPPDEVRTFMEPRFGADFSQVRVHTGSEAVQMNRELNAQAFTHKHDVYFGAGKAPGKDALTAHELTHVVQQSGVAIQNSTSRSLSASILQADISDLQREPTTAQNIHSRITALVRSPDPMEVIRIMDLPEFKDATEAERLSLIRIANQFGGGDPNRLATLWSSFGEGRLPEVAAAHMADWEKSTSLWPGLPDLIPVVNKTVQAFRVALQKLAEFNLAENEKYVQARMEQMGFAQGATKPMTPEEMKNYRQNIQKIAYSIWDIRQTQKKMRQKEIGATAGRVSLPVTFDPSGPHAHEGPAGINVELWNKLKAEWDEGQKPVIKAAAEYPEIYELLAQGNDEAILNFSRVMTEDPTTPKGGSMNAAEGQGYQTKAKELLVSLADRIHKVQGELGKLDFLELKPLQERLLASSGRWNHGFDKLIAVRAVERHARDEHTLQVLANMGEMAAALVGTFATGGLGLAVGAIAVGGGVARAAIDIAEAGRLDSAAKATPKGGTELVTQAQADAKTIEANAALFAAIIGALLLGGAKGIEFLEGRLSKLLAGMVADEALLKNLLVKCPNKRQLIRMLGKSDSPSELKALLDTVELEKIEAYLDFRAATRARIRTLRAQHQPRLDANPSIEKDLQDAEAALKIRPRQRQQRSKLTVWLSS